MNERSPLVVANLKANKTWEEIANWLKEVGSAAKDFTGTIIFCPSHPFIASSYQEIQSQNYNIRLGTQDISVFTEGAYTGEVAASQVKDIVGYAIIGHSERRKNFKEEESVLEKKVANAQDANIEPIFCIQSQDTEIANNVSIVAYEPLFAIGTGNPDTIDSITKTTEAIKQKGPYLVLYGGSVSKDNVHEIVRGANTDGVLVGATNSLDPQKFKDIVKALA